VCVEGVILQKSGKAGSQLVFERERERERDIDESERDVCVEGVILQKSGKAGSQLVFVKVFIEDESHQEEQEISNSTSRSQLESSPEYTGYIHIHTHHKRAHILRKRAHVFCKRAGIFRNRALL